MKRWFMVPLTAAIIGENVPLVLGLAGSFPGIHAHTLSGAVTVAYVTLTIWPSSIFLMLLDGADRSRDAEIWATAILLNAVLYAIIGVIGYATFRAWRFLFGKRRREAADGANDEATAA